jgi:hypothetical protein
MPSFHRHVPAPLRTLALTLTMVSLCGALVLVAEAVMWIEAHPAILLLVGTCLAAIVAFRMSRPSRHPRFQQVPQFSRFQQPPQPPQPRRATPHRPANQPCRPAVTRPQIVYWGGVRVGTLDEQGHFRPDR